MTKEDVIDKRLENYVLQSDEGQPTFAAWWKSLAGDDEVEVQFPHERHGLAGRVSNHHIEGVMADFLQLMPTRNPMAASRVATVPNSSLILRSQG